MTAQANNVTFIKAGLDAVVNLGTWPYFALKYSLPVYDPNTDTDIHTDPFVGVTSAVPTSSSLTSSLSSASQFVNYGYNNGGFYNELLFNGFTYSTSANTTLAYKSSAQTGGGLNYTLFNGQSSIKYVNQIAQGYLNDYNSGTDVVSDGTNLVSISNWSDRYKAAAYTALTSAAWDRSKLYQNVNYIPEIDGVDIVGNYQVVLDSSVGPFRFNKIILFAQKYSDATTIDLTSAPVPFAVISLANSVDKKGVGEIDSSITSFIGNFKLKFTPNGGTTEVSANPDQYWAKHPGTAAGTSALAYPGSIILQDISGSPIVENEAKSKIHLLEPSGEFLRLQFGSGTNYRNINVTDTGAIDLSQTGIMQTGIVAGYASSATGTGSISLGYGTSATAQGAMAIGDTTKASGLWSFASGSGTIASGSRSVAIGRNTSASGSESFASGYLTSAMGVQSSVFGANNLASGSQSMAIGSRTSATGGESIAFGLLSQATGTASTAWGNQTTASASNATTWGNTTKASTAGATAFGNNTRAAATYSTTWGLNSSATSQYATAWGTTTKASGDYSTAWGSNTLASGEYSTAWGNTTTASAESSTSLGYATNASGLYSFAGGSSTYASGAGSFAFGNLARSQSGYTTTFGCGTTANNIVNNKLYSFLWGAGDSSLLGVGNPDNLGTPRFQLITVKKTNMSNPAYLDFGWAFKISNLVSSAMFEYSYTGYLYLGSDATTLEYHAALPSSWSEV